MDGLLSSTQQAVHSIELFSYRRHTSGLDRSVSGSRCRRGQFAALEVLHDGQDHAAEAPLATQDSVEQSGVGTAPLHTDVVEGAHHGTRAALLDAHLEGLQVDLANRLLVGPGGELAQSVGLLVVQREVLHEGVHALGLSASDLLGSHHAEQVAVFGEVFEGTTGEVAAFESDIVIDSISGSRYCPCIAVPLLNVPGWLTFGSPPTHP